MEPVSPIPFSFLLDSIGTFTWIGITIFILLLGLAATIRSDVSLRLLELHSAFGH